MAARHQGMAYRAGGAIDGHIDKSDDAAVAIGRSPAELDGLAGENRLQSRLGRGTGRSPRVAFPRSRGRRDIDRRQPDLASVVEDEAPAVEDFGDLSGPGALEPAGLGLGLG